MDMILVCFGETIVIVSYIMLIKCHKDSCRRKSKNLFFSISIMYQVPSFPFV